MEKKLNPEAEILDDDMLEQASGGNDLVNANRNLINTYGLLGGTGTRSTEDVASYGLQRNDSVGTYGLQRNDSVGTYSLQRNDSVAKK